MKCHIRRDMKNKKTGQKVPGKLQEAFNGAVFQAFFIGEYSLPEC